MCEEQGVTMKDKMYLHKGHDVIVMDEMYLCDG